MLLFKKEGVIIIKDFNTENHYTVYMHKNKINDKVYIGMTGNIPRKRWKYGHGYKKSYFYNAIKKYGWDGFNHIILKENLSFEEAEEWEKFYIQKYNSTNKSCGYNIAIGGGVNRGYHLSEERKENLRKKLSGENGSFYGRRHTDETKQKISESKHKPVLQYTMNGKYLCRYNSVKEASEKNNICHSNISQVCVGNREYSGGFIWKYEEDCNVGEDLNYSVKSRLKPVAQYTKNGEFITKYDSVIEATKACGFSSDSKISECCKGKRKSTGGYQWRYYDENEENIEPLTKVDKRIEINQYDLDGNHIKTWESSWKILQDCGYATSNICKCCKGQLNTAYGYIWKYAS